MLRPRAVPGVPGRFGANGVFCRTAADQAAGSADTGQSYLPAPDNYSLTTNTYNGIRLALLLSLLLGQGVPQVISSVSGQNVYSAQYTTYRRPSMPDNNQDGGWGSTNRVFGSSGMSGSGGIGGDISPMLSGGMNLALLSFDGTGSSSQLTGQRNGASSTQAASGQGGDLSSLLQDLQSLLPALSGTTTATTSGSSDSSSTSTDTTSGSSASSSIGNTGTASTTDISKRLLQDLQALASYFGPPAPASTDMASLKNGQQSAPSEPPPGPPPWNPDVVNTGTATAQAGSDGSTAASGTRDNSWQQFMLAAYAWGTDRAASSSTAGVTV
ncbi:MAG: hypothetical protein ACJ8AI_12400 [Rhodopila sp.]